MCSCKREMRGGEKKTGINIIHRYVLVLDTGDCPSNDSSIFFFANKIQIWFRQQNAQYQKTNSVLSHLVYLPSFISLTHSPNIFLNAHHMPNTILSVRKTKKT